MNKEKQTKKVSRQRQEYLKFKPFADDLRKAESWCELDGVLNRYQTVKNLSKMGYRKISDDHQRQCTCYALGCQMAEELKRKVAMEIFEQIDDTMELICAMTGLDIVLFSRYAELKNMFVKGKTNER